MSTCDFTLQTDLSSIKYCATGVFYVSLDLFRSMFLFSAPITDCSLNPHLLNDSQADISYCVLSNLYPHIHRIRRHLVCVLAEGLIRNTMGVFLPYPS